MAKAAGRLALLKKNATTIGGVRVTNIMMDATPIDVTDNDSLGVQELLGVPGSRILSFDVEGVQEDAVLRDIAFTAASSLLLTDMTFTFGSAEAGADVISGNFFMTNYKEGNDYKEATTFSASFTSAGAWTLS
jgi:predicted secreted protein